MQFGCAEVAGIRAWVAPTAAMVLIAIAQGAAAQGALPPGFVYLRDVDPSIAQDIRYAGSDNFVGRPLPGYGAAECILRREVAAALQRAQAALRAGGLSLKVYDCYRPMRAVRAMVQWVNDGRPEAPTKRFFPKLRKGLAAQRLYRLAIPAFDRQHDRPHVDQGRRGAGCAVRSGRHLRTLHGPRRPAEPRQQRRHGHELRLL
jgi:D-alanyl-D-alanine dipeptidase